MYFGVVGFFGVELDFPLPLVDKASPLPLPHLPLLLPLGRVRLSFQLFGWILRGLLGVFEFPGVVLGLV